MLRAGRGIEIDCDSYQALEAPRLFRREVAAQLQNCTGFAVELCSLMTYLAGLCGVMHTHAS